MDTTSDGLSIVTSLFSCIADLSESVYSVIFQGHIDTWQGEIKTFMQIRLVCAALLIRYGY